MKTSTITKVLFTAAFLMIACVSTSARSADETWGETARVTSNEELVKALYDESIQTIHLAPGHYAYFTQQPALAGEGLITKNRGDGGKSCMFMQHRIKFL